jgi:DNA-binding beta-propeller fold protein YncE
LALTTAFLFVAGCGESAKPTTASPKTAAAFWPQPPDEPRIQFLTTYNAASDVKEKKSTSGLSDLLYGKDKEQDLGISKPYGVAMHDGKLYVCDLRGYGILVLDLKKKESRLMGAQGQGQVKRPVDIAVAPDGTKYVADLRRAEIVVFDAAERYVRAFGSADFNPVGLAVSGDELFVVDSKAKQVKVLNRQTGQVLRAFGKEGPDDGQFIQPLSITVDKQGNVVVTDVLRCRVQKFTKDGTFVSGFGRMGDRPGDFFRPKHVRVGSDGTTFVVDAAFNNVQAFDEEGKVMGYFGSLGTHPGAMDLPAGLFISEDPRDIELFASQIHPDFQAERLVIVTNQFGTQKVSVYAAGHLKPGKTAAGLMSTISNTAGLATTNEPQDILSKLSQPATQPATLPASNR